MLHSHLEKFSSKYTVNFLKLFSCQKWLEERPKELVNTLVKLCGFTNMEEDRASFMLCKIIETIYCCRNARLILPLSLRENLLLYSYCGSKTIANYIGTTSPGGSQTYILQWLNAQAGHEAPVHPGLVRALMDNEQIVGKSYSVKTKKNAIVSVIVSVISSLTQKATCWRMLL